MSKKPLTEEEQKELEALKAEGEKLGLTISPNIGLDTLRNKIEEAKKSETTTEEENEENEETKQEAETVKKNQEKMKKIKDMSRLIRVIVTNNNPDKTNVTSEIHSAGNKYEKVTKAVKFNEPWHIPVVIYEKLKEQKLTRFISKKDSRGREFKEATTIPAYNIQVLENLTEEEVKELEERLKSNGITTG